MAGRLPSAQVVGVDDDPLLPALAGGEHRVSASGHAELLRRAGFGPACPAPVDLIAADPAGPVVRPAPGTTGISRRTSLRTRAQGLPAVTEAATWHAAHPGCDRDARPHRTAQQIHDSSRVSTTRSAHYGHRPHRSRSR
ncbi:hypothetical protein ACFOWE_11605 [Planomonospora corallina]|uniref:Uncharacterized protein n=1 Tax=Planomonospora corallina TaxID=1806052 RepID=A0ABV8I6Z0_9ACTN